MAFEGMNRVAFHEQEPRTEMDSQSEQLSDVVSVRKERLLSFIAAKVAATEKEPATAMSDGLVAQLENIGRAVADCADVDPTVMERKMSMYESKLRAFGYEAQAPELAPAPAAAVLGEVLLPVVVPAPVESEHEQVSATPETKEEAVIETIDIDNEAEWTEHVAGVRSIQTIIDRVSAEVRSRRDKQEVDKQKALGYARVDLQKWNRIVDALSQARVSSPARTAELMSLLQNHYNSVRGNLERLAPGHLPFVSYERVVNADNADIPTPEPVSAEPATGASGIEAIPVEDIRQQSPALSESLVLGARERVAHDEQFVAVVKELDRLTLDEQDRQFVAVCIENYQKYQELGDSQKAGSYLHNLEEVRTRKQSEAVTGTAHDVIRGRAAMIEASLDAMRVVSPEEAVTVSAMVDNVRRLLDTSSGAIDRATHEQKIQQTYQSLETLYREFTEPEVDKLATPLDAVSEVEVGPTVLDQPSVVAAPRITGVPARELRPSHLENRDVSTERMNRVRVLWSRIPEATKAAMIAMLAVFASPDTSSKQAVGFNPAPVTALGTITSGWATADTFAGGSVGAAAAAESSIDIPAQVVRPFTGQVAAAEAVGQEVSVVTSESAPSTNNNTVEYVRAAAEGHVGVSVIDSNVERTTVPESSMIRVSHGIESTYPDRAIDTVLDTVETNGLPEVLVARLRNEVKTAFLSDAATLREAGISSGDKNIVYAGERVDYSEARNRLTEAINEHRQFLNVPHTEVAAAGENLTRLVLRSYADDLAVIPEVDRLSVTENALANYLTKSEALRALHLEDKDTIPAGAVIPLGVLADSLSQSVARYVTAGAAREGMPVETEEPAASSVHEVVPEMVVDDITLPEATAAPSSESVSAVALTPETYPGGMLQYSEDYNRALETIGIASAPKSFMDPWFSRGPDNRALLDVTVGQLDKIMDLPTSQEILAELTSLGIELEAAEKAKRHIIEARKSGVLPRKLGLDMSFADLMKKLVLDAAQAET